MFKKQIIIIFLLISMLMITGCKNVEKRIDDFPEIVNKLESYKITGKLYSSANFNCFIKTSLWISLFSLFQ